HQEIKVSSMHVRAMGMRRLLFLPTVAVRMPVVVSMAMTVDLRDCMTARIPFMAVAVVVIMPMRRWRIGRFRNPSLFPCFRCYRHFVIVLGPTPFRVRHESLERGFVHVARQRNP